MTIETMINRPCTLRKRAKGSTRDGYGKRVTRSTDSESVVEIQPLREDQQSTAGITATGEFNAYFLALTITPGTKSSPSTTTSPTTS